MSLQLWQIGLLIVAGVVAGGITQAIVLVVRKIKADRASADHAATPEA